MDVRYLESIAQQLVARVREEGPDENQRWLHNVTTAADREALLYILAAAVPDTERWSDLVAWCSDRSPRDSPLRQAMRRQALLRATAPRRKREAA